MRPADTGDAADDRVYIEVKKLVRSRAKAPWDKRQQVIDGSFETNVYGRDGHAKIKLPFVEKPWVFDFDEFSKSQTGREQFLILSTEFANDEQSAKTQSARLAVEVIKPFVKNEVKALFVRPRFNMADELPDAIGDGTFVLDQFAQQLLTPNGPVWRHAMLVDLRDVKPFMTMALARHHRIEKAEKQVRRATHQRRAFRFGGLIALLGSVCAIYWVLDTMTKGYFAGRVGVILTVFGLVGMALILLMS